MAAAVAALALAACAPSVEEVPLASSPAPSSSAAGSGGTSTGAAGSNVGGGDAGTDAAPNASNVVDAGLPVEGGLSGCAARPVVCAPEDGGVAASPDAELGTVVYESGAACVSTLGGCACGVYCGVVTVWFDSEGCATAIAENAVNDAVYAELILRLTTKRWACAAGGSAHLVIDGYPNCPIIGAPNPC